MPSPPPPPPPKWLESAVKNLVSNKQHAKQIQPNQIIYNSLITTTLTVASSSSSIWISPDDGSNKRVQWLHAEKSKKAYWKNRKSLLVTTKSETKVELNKSITIESVESQDSLEFQDNANLSSTRKTMLDIRNKYVYINAFVCVIICCSQVFYWKVCCRSTVHSRVFTQHASASTQPRVCRANW